LIPVVVRTVVLCPGLTGSNPYDAAAVKAALAAQARPPARAGAAPECTAICLEPDDGPEAPDASRRQAAWVARVAVALSVAGPAGPILLVLRGDTGALAPHLCLTQRAAHRQVAGYVLVDADCPPPGTEVSDWPDAPVAYVASPDAPQGAAEHARRRGWRRIEVPDLSMAALSRALGQVIDPRPAGG
jgi:hypothetical protein